MWRFLSRLSNGTVGARTLMLRPEATLDVVRYPQGFVPLDGSERIDAVYSLIKAGHFVAPLHTIECIHKVHLGVRKLCSSEYPVLSAQDIANAQLKEREFQSRVLIRRDFWTLDDFNDPELNRSFGIQNLYFDNYKWSQVLWRRFQLFVEEYFPTSEHTHVTYDEYMDLIRSFSVFEQGKRVVPLLPKSFKIHPPYGVPVPTKVTLEPLLLLQRWLRNFRRPLALHRALVVNVSSGLTAFMIRLCSVPMVRATDPSPRAIAACRADAARHSANVSGISFRVGEMFADVKDRRASGESAAPRKYDLIVYYPDEQVLATFTDEGSIYAPGSTGFAGNLEQFFENAGPHLSDSGVLVICCTNLNSLLRPSDPHPIEYEVRVNRRYVILDYYDAPIRYRGNITTAQSDPKIRNSFDLRQKMRSELWILHKVESIQHFGFFHGVPGAKPPATVRGQWGGRNAMRNRQRALREHVELMGGDWGDYKSRLISMLQDQSDEPEDDVAEAVRMALDPTYPEELARQARAAVDSASEAEEEFHRKVAEDFVDVSPRELFDRKKHH